MRDFGALCYFQKKEHLSLPTRPTLTLNGPKDAEREKATLRQQLERYELEENEKWNKEEEHRRRERLYQEQLRKKEKTLHQVGISASCGRHFSSITGGEKGHYPSCLHLFYSFFFFDFLERSNGGDQNVREICEQPVLSKKTFKSIENIHALTTRRDGDEDTTSSNSSGEKVQKLEPLTPHRVALVRQKWEARMASQNVSQHYSVFIVLQNYLYQVTCCFPNELAMKQWELMKISSKGF
ncbi:unnamed protein product [Gongylonema pulchrum]|uniref:CCDC50_N domain-containing protein n=1 Tax=Gongylonema pulchrum TaxID=637853 RepID=A0A183E8K9_9BILA|nr:unnamed protein product [Gongylonema pulchrum]